MTFYILTALSWLGIVWDLKAPPAQVLRNEQRLGARVIHRAAEQLAASFNSERIATALHAAELSALRERLARAHDRASELLSAHLSQMPVLPDCLAEARAMFAKTPSLEEIAERAHGLLLAAVGRRLLAPLERTA
jgi:stearoyl-CoA desaturase (delta-9 desaturase)